MRKKLKEEDKKRKMTITIDEDLFQIFEEYMNEINISNKTKYIEKLIKDDLKNRKLLNNDFLY
jgi:metal-responsive CopG/Arc/MetJ family transcriptional regulator